MLVIASELADPATTPAGVSLRAVVSQTPHLDGREVNCNRHNRHNYHNRHNQHGRHHFTTSPLHHFTTSLQNRKKNMKPPPEVRALVCVRLWDRRLGVRVGFGLQQRLLHLPSLPHSPRPSSSPLITQPTTSNQGRGILGALTISLASLCDIARSVAFQVPTLLLRSIPISVMLQFKAPFYHVEPHRNPLKE